MGISSDRPIKMYKVFYYMKKVMEAHKVPRTTPSYYSELQSLTNQLLSVCKNEFGVVYPLSWLLIPSGSCESVLNLILEIKIRIVELDIGRMFRSTEKILENLFVPFRNTYPDLDPKVYRALFGQCYPATMCLNVILRKQVDYVNRLSSNDESLNVFELGIAKYFLADNILSMRAAHSISLAESQMTK